MNNKNILKLNDYKKIATRDGLSFSDADKCHTINTGETVYTVITTPAGNDRNGNKLVDVTVFENEYNITSYIKTGIGTHKNKKDTITLHFLNLRSIQKDIIKHIEETKEHIKQ